tara:strand:+ start:204 stop:761 length:558 start_codon:yes stop_codon:yes gene_type:complete
VFFKKLSWIFKKKELKRIKLLVLDVDGVLTDGGLYLSSEGELLKKFNVKDGLGIKLLQNNKIEVVFLSGGAGGSTEIRAQQLNIKYCFVKVKDKNKAILNLQKELGYSKYQTAYLGDDINDLVVRNNVNLLIAPRDSCEIILEKADFILNSKGGNGAIRELSEKILKSQNKYKSYSELGWIDIND